MRDLLMAAIRAYQRWISPHKGFVCAYRVHTGRASCSALGLRAVRRHGVWGGLALIRRRTRRCGDVHRAHRPARPLVMGTQRGVCDLDCGPCDLDGDLPGRGGIGNWFSCCDCCSCDWPRRRERQPRERPAKPLRTPIARAIPPTSTPDT